MWTNAQFNSSMSQESPTLQSFSANPARSEDFGAGGARNPQRESLKARLVLLVVLFLSAMLASYWLNRGWIPGDDGTLATGALRVLHGELPHRDFGETYTGGLDYFHAIAFRLLGVNLTALRMAVFAVFLAWVPAVFAISRRFASPIPSGLLTLLCVAWSLPTYPAAMPSWYNLFFATFGALAILRHLESQKSRWLFVAGVVGGLSFLVKVTGLYYIAAVLLFLMYLEQRQSATSVREERPGGDLTYRVFQTVALSLFVLAVCFLVRGNLTVFTATEIALPPVILALALILRGIKRTSESSGARFIELSRKVLPFLGGLVVPIACFLIPYWRSASLHTFFSGVFLAGANRAASLIRPPQSQPHYELFAYSGLLALAIVFCMYTNRQLAKVFAWGVGALGLLLMVITVHSKTASLALFYAAALILPAVVLYGIFLLRRYESQDDGRGATIFLLIALASTGSLIRFPFPAPIYFCYCAPMVLLALGAVVLSSDRRQGAPPLVVLAIFGVLFGAFRIVPSFIYLGTFTPGSQVYPLLSERGANVSAMDALAYDEVAHLVRQRAKGGKILAFAECPEVFFLSGLENAASNDNGIALDDIERASRDQGLKVIVINQMPFFPSSKASPQVESLVNSRFSQRTQIGKYKIYWRE
jgi:hypothetical protein